MKSTTVIAAAFAMFALAYQTSIVSAAPDISGKVVLANLDRYHVHLRFGTTQRDINPRKASVLSPKKYPVTIEYWSGNTKSGWRKQQITRAGIYGFNFKTGSWILTELKKGTTKRAPAPSRAVLRRRVVRQPVRRAPINADRARWSPLASVLWFGCCIYEFVRDEEDRDLLRQLLIYGREEDAEKFRRWLDASDKIPELYKKDLKEAFDDLEKLSEKDWKDIASADDKDWADAKAELGDLVSEKDWQNLQTDFADINTDDYWKGGTEVDLDDLDLADNLDIDNDGDLDLGNLDVNEDVDLGDLGVDHGSYDLGAYDDYGGYDGAFDVDPGDYGGGYFGDDDFGDFGGGDDFDF